MRVRALLIPMLLGALQGCASIKTTFYTRHEDDTLCKERDCPLNGVPVMVKVPTHLEVKVNETLHFYKHQGKARLDLINQNSYAIREVEPSLRFTEKMFVVDPKRPLSGTATYGFTFAGAADADSEKNGHGYLKGVKYKVDDETITNVIDLIANITPLLASPVANGVNESDKPASITNVYTTKRTIAYAIFDLAAPDLEHQVNAFLEMHVNGCSPCAEGSGTVPTRGLEHAAPE